MVLAILIPNLANSLRVFTIVLIGYFVDMKYASGADHLIYGWVFFGIVLFLLVILGETFREKTEAAQINSDKLVLGDFRKWQLSKGSLFTAFFVLIVLYIWQVSLALKSDTVNTVVDRKALTEFSIEKPLTGRWNVIFNGYTDFYTGTLIQQEAEKPEIVLVWYPQNKEGKELISSQNALYDKGVWSSVSEVTTSLGGDLRVSLLEIVSNTGQNRFILSWYQLKDKAVASKSAGKIYQAFDVMFSGNGAGALVAFSLPFKNSEKENVKAKLLSDAKTVADKIYYVLPF
jgi:EpsI family protein